MSDGIELSFDASGIGPAANAGAKYTDNFNLRLPEGERSRIKKWCVNHDISMNMFFYMSAEYVMSQVEQDKVKATKLGIRPAE